MRYVYLKTRSGHVLAELKRIDVNEKLIQVYVPSFNPEAFSRLTCPAKGVKINIYDQDGDVSFDLPEGVYFEGC